jgi:hypothetical protein
MTYLLVRWRHSNPDEPVVLYSELDDQRMQRRKIDIYPDGRWGFADETVAARCSRPVRDYVAVLDVVSSAGAEPDTEGRGSTGRREASRLVANGSKLDRAQLTNEQCSRGRRGRPPGSWPGRQPYLSWLPLSRFALSRSQCQSGPESPQALGKLRQSVSVGKSWQPSDASACCSGGGGTALPEQATRSQDSSKSFAALPRWSDVATSTVIPRFVTATIRPQSPSCRPQVHPRSHCELFASVVPVQRHQPVGLRHDITHVSIVCGQVFRCCRRFTMSLSSRSMSVVLQREGTLRA